MNPSTDAAYADLDADDLYDLCGGDDDWRAVQAAIDVAANYRHPTADLLVLRAKVEEALIQLANDAHDAANVALPHGTPYSGRP